MARSQSTRRSTTRSSRRTRPGPRDRGGRRYWSPAETAVRSEVSVRGTHTCTHTYMHVPRDKHIHTFTNCTQIEALHSDTRTYKHTHTCTHTHTHRDKHTHTRTHTHTQYTDTIHRHSRTNTHITYPPTYTEGTHTHYKHVCILDSHE